MLETEWVPKRLENGGAKVFAMSASRGWSRPKVWVMQSYHDHCAREVNSWWSVLSITRSPRVLSNSVTLSQYKTVISVGSAHIVVTV